MTLDAKVAVAEKAIDSIVLDAATDATKLTALNNLADLIEDAIVEVEGDDTLDVYDEDREDEYPLDDDEE